MDGHLLIYKNPERVVVSFPVTSMRAGNLVSGIKGLCATVGAAKTVTLETCAKPVAANQVGR